MNDNEFGLTTDGENVKQVPVESKEPTLVSTPAEMSKPEPVAARVPVEKKKRGRPSKKVVETTKELSNREFYCSTCREFISERNAMKIGAGDNRNALFCGQCQKALGFVDVVAEEKLAQLHKNPSQK